MSKWRDHFRWHQPEIWDYRTTTKTRFMSSLSNGQVCRFRMGLIRHQQLSKTSGVFSVTVGKTQIICKLPCWICMFRLFISKTIIIDFQFLDIYQHPSAISAFLSFPLSLQQQRLVDSTFLFSRKVQFTCQEILSAQRSDYQLRNLKRNLGI